MASLYSDLISDLEAAKKASLLIEIQQKHIKHLTEERSDFVLNDEYRKIFDKDIGPTKTNVIIVDAKRGAEAQILTDLYGLVGDSLKMKKTLQSSLKLGLYFATLGLSELVDSSITDNVTDMLGKSIDAIDGTFSKWIGDEVEDHSMDKVEDTADKLLNAGNATHQIGTELYLSKKTKTTLVELASDLSHAHTPHEAVRFLVKLISSLGIGAPKLLVINDPFSLDTESLSLCSLLFSHAKDLKLQVSADSFPVSVVFNYTAQQPYDTDLASEANALSLMRLRHMTQRYGMLEKPGSSIPFPAITSTTFVGREQELIQLHRDHDALLEMIAKEKSKTFNQWTLIRGEPGTGKTALINKHLNKLTQQKDRLSVSQIRLRLLNQVGHSSEVTGLASLLQSIKSESKRLTLYYKEHTGWLRERIDNKINSFKEVASVAKDVKNNRSASFDQVRRAAKAIASLTNSDTLYGSVEAAIDRYSLDKSHIQTADAMADGGSRNRKKEQFDILASALLHLRNIARAVNGRAEQLPMLVFVDDLQWIDELSAEFILTRLVGIYPLEFLITARQSDSETSYKLAQAQREHSPYKLSIFDIARLGASSAPYPLEDTHKTLDQSVTAPIKLLGMDKSTLVNLINTVYEIDHKLDVGVIANSLIKAIGEDKYTENPQVNTLFVVEALNLLSDPAFYRLRNHDIVPLFVKNESGILCINPTPEMDFAGHVEMIFKRLDNEYYHSFSNENMQTDNKYFTLSAFAVLEERLFIISQYLGDHANVANLGLQFSAASGEPFNSRLIGNFLKKLAELNIEDYPELSDMINYLQGQKSSDFNTEILEILEETFEILKRLNSINEYKFKHGLFHSFLLQKFSKSLHDFGFFKKNNEVTYVTTYKSDADFSKKITDVYDVYDQPIESLCVLFLEECYLFFKKNHSLTGSFHSQQKITKSFIDFMKKYHLIGWDEVFFDNLIEEANQHGKFGTGDSRRISGVSKIVNKAEYLMKYVYLNNSVRWSGRYASVLFNIGMANRHEDSIVAISYFELAYDIVKANYQVEPKNWQHALSIIIERLTLILRHPGLYSKNYEQEFLHRKKAQELEVELNYIVLRECWEPLKTIDSIDTALSKFNTEFQLTGFLITTFDKKDLLLSNLEKSFSDLLKIMISKKTNRLLDVSRFLSNLIELVIIKKSKSMSIEAVEQVFSFIDINRSLDSREVVPHTVKLKYYSQVSKLIKILDQPELLPAAKKLQKEFYGFHI